MQKIMGSHHRRQRVKERKITKIMAAKVQLGIFVLEVLCIHPQTTFDSDIIAISLNIGNTAIAFRQHILEREEKPIKR